MRGINYASLKSLAEPFISAGRKLKVLFSRKSSGQTPPPTTENTAASSLSEKQAKPAFKAAQSAKPKRKPLRETTVIDDIANFKPGLTD